MFGLSGHSYLHCQTEALKFFFFLIWLSWTSVSASFTWSRVQFFFVSRLEENRKVSGFMAHIEAVYSSIFPPSLVPRRSIWARDESDSGTGQNLSSTWWRVFCDVAACKYKGMFLREVLVFVNVHITKKISELLRSLHHSNCSFIFRQKDEMCSHCPVPFNIAKDSDFSQHTFWLLFLHV